MSPIVTQQDYFAAVATRVVLPMLAERKQAIRHGLLVARSGRHASTMQGDSLNQLVPGHQRPDLARRHPQRRRQSGPPARGSGRARPRRHHRHRRHRRSRLLDDLQAERHQPGRQGQLRRRPGGLPAAGLRRHRPRPCAGHAAASIPTTRGPRSRPARHGEVRERSDRRRPATIPR